MGSLYLFHGSGSPPNRGLGLPLRPRRRVLRAAGGPPGTGGPRSAGGAGVQVGRGVCVCVCVLRGWGSSPKILRGWGSSPKIKVFQAKTTLCSCWRTHFVPLVCNRALMLVPVRKPDVDPVLGMQAGQPRTPHGDSSLTQILDFLGPKDGDEGFRLSW